MITFKNMLRFITDDLKPDILFWTGDNSPHNIWSNTADEVVAYTMAVTTMIKQALEGSGITVFPIQGNHDAWPEEMYDFEESGTNYEIK